ncbi:ZYBA0S08-04434g1_1 [Zygosaccharomyces bailii CLIB 213]|uniref:ZYBA0S08-04434g1_1 n=1 Tax=Zygosaccharomyces bailii (strain CLIB 213 / ATCC 58445 / CBS 680 / BCRC 21525 / NBRC 1098 / NCYC 1416 / NRRL Y-2227) TaxID=1333698 RepID=A0A8J2TAD7_ZYGB2|nr:ZYBA0S08-04434g1_1 [Zygosaccharomyces bailii CLIB 213]
MFRLQRFSSGLNQVCIALRRSSPIQTCKATPMTAGLFPLRGRVTFIQPFSTSLKLLHGHLTPPKPGEELHVTFILRDGTQRTFEVAEGDTLLDIAQANNLEMEGACGGSCACSTCHVIVDPDYFDALPEPSDDENDMLDLAYGLTETSRLGCQIKMTKDIDGIRVALPAMTRNVSASDFN